MQHWGSTFTCLLLMRSAEAFIPAAPLLGIARRGQADQRGVRHCRSETQQLQMSGRDGPVARAVAAVAAAFLIASPFSALAEISNAEVVSEVAGGGATVEIAPTPEGSNADGANVVRELAKQATVEQVKRVKQEEQQTLRLTAQREPEGTIARLVVSIKSETFPLGYPDTSAFPALLTEDAHLVVTAFGRQGPPVAAKRMKLKGLQFPVVLDLTDDDLVFPLTKDAWRADARSEDDIGVAVVLDVDGKLATLDSGDLTGYAVSKVIKLGGQAQRTEAVVAVQPNKALEERGQNALPREEISVLERIDAQLALRDGEI